MAQHVLAVVARSDRFDDAGNTGSIEAAQQDRGLYLCRCHGQAIFQRQRVHGAMNRQRQAPAGTGLEAGTAGGQRIDDALHGSAAQAGIPGHDGETGAAGQDAGEQACGRAGIAHVQHVFGLPQAAYAPPGHGPAFRALDDLGPQRPHGSGGTEHVIAFQQAGDTGLT